jgi:hypothetical protein
LSGIQTLIRRDRLARPSAYAVVMLVCLALLALLTVVQVAHVHAVGTDADHCPLCVVLHTAAPVAAAAAVIVLVQIEAAAPVIEIRAVTRLFDPQLFTRPPPPGSTASFRLLVLA